MNAPRLVVTLNEDELVALVRRVVVEVLEQREAAAASDWIGDEEAATILGMKVSSLRKRLQPSSLAGEHAVLASLPVHYNGRRRRFMRSEVEGWLAARGRRKAA